MANEKEQVKQTLKSAVETVKSPAEADQVLDEVERFAADVTEAEAGRGAEATPLSPPEAVRRAAQAAPPGKQAAASLAAAAAEIASEQPNSETVLEAAQEVFQPAPTDGQPAAEKVKPRGFLQEAVLRRMSPLQAWDAWLFIAVNHLPHTRLTTALMELLTMLTVGGLAWMVGTVIAWRRGTPRSRRALRELVPTVSVATWIVEYPVKSYFKRRRPFIDVVRALVIGKKPGSWSFPSGHTASSFASAQVLSAVWPRQARLFYALATLVGFSRIYVGAHYPGDVLSGAALGAALSEITRRLLRALWG